MKDGFELEDVCLVAEVESEVIEQVRDGRITSIGIVSPKSKNEACIPAGLVLVICDKGAEGVLGTRVGVQNLHLKQVNIEELIYVVRGQKVMIDSDLAMRYEEETKYLKRAVRAHIKRFPDDFMFELTKEEYAALRCKNSTIKSNYDSNAER